MEEDIISNIQTSKIVHSKMTKIVKVTNQVLEYVARGINGKASLYSGAIFLTIGKAIWEC